MKFKSKISALFIGAIVISISLAAAGPRQTQPEAPKATVMTVRSLPLELGAKLPISVESAGMEWRGYTYHLLGLHEIRFDPDKASGHLTAEVHGWSASFDEVGYDISVAVLDGDGALLGSARGKCEVHRMWLGRVSNTSEKIPLDFGISLDYGRAARFLITVSNRKVITPDQWPPAKK